MKKHNNMTVAIQTMGKDAIRKKYLQKYDKLCQKEYGVSFKEILYGFYVEDKLTTTDIGAIFKVNPVAIWKWLKYFHIPRRKSGALIDREYPNKMKKINGKTTKDIIIEYRYKGMTLKEIAKKTGLNMWTVCRYNPMPFTWFIDGIPYRRVKNVVEEKREYLYQTDWKDFSERHPAVCPTISYNKYNAKKGDTYEKI